jgi:hypothetical protein
MAMIQQLDLATLFVTLSDEKRWPHLLKLLALVDYNRQLTDELCHHSSCSEKWRLLSSDPVTCLAFLIFFQSFKQSQSCKKLYENLQFVDLVSLGISW